MGSSDGFCAILSHVWTEFNRCKQTGAAEFTWPYLSCGRCTRGQPLGITWCPERKIFIELLVEDDQSIGTAAGLRSGTWMDIHILAMRETRLEPFGPGP